MNKAVLSFSGGQDSTTVLMYALKKFDYVETIGFDYGQRKAIELKSRKVILEKIRERFPELTKKLGIDTVLNVRSFAEVAQCAMTNKDIEFKREQGKLPTSFVPARNIMFLSYVAARAYVIGAHTILNGCNAADYSGYPDCRASTMEALEKTLSLGCEYDFKIESPLMFSDKAEIWKLAKQVGGDELVDFIVRETHTCYEGDHEHFHEWGYGCGKCSGCLVRADGWKKFKESSK